VMPQINRFSIGILKNNYMRTISFQKPNVILVTNFFL
jgi:hypothetical protein